MEMLKTFSISTTDYDFQIPSHRLELPSMFVQCRAIMLNLALPKRGNSINTESYVKWGV